MPFERRYISSPKAWLTFLRFCENVWLTFPRIPPKVSLVGGVSDTAVGRLIGTQTFTTAGVTNWTFPGDAKFFEVIVTGAGGSGLGGPDSSKCGPGGGAGGTAIKLVDRATITGSTIAVTVGAGVANANGQTSSFGSIVSATGGEKGSSSNAGGIGGNGTGGDINIPGGFGSNGPALTAAAGDGHGGDSYWGGGNRGVNNTSNTVSCAPGGGGGGSLATSGAQTMPGADGIVYVRIYA
ncbi:hypothetical protein WP3S18E05_29310 [Klebsiella sp. WP3-S18-ESBL-05]|nr:hypothetical protein WP3S18E05_29310 [Klebsiella sp. WP3-S18-ESBL-05]